MLSVFLLASCSRNDAETAASESSDVHTPAVAEVAGEEPSAAPKPTTGEGAEEERVMPWANWGEAGAVTLMDAGKPPLRKLRRTFKNGETERLTLTLDASGSEKAWKFQYLLTLRTTSLSDDGSEAKVAVEVGEATTMGESVEGPSMNGVKGQFSITSLGRISDFKLVAPAEADAATLGAISALERSFRVVGLPLPEEPVGVGAKWALYEIVRPESPIAQRVVYELTTLEGSMVEVKTTVEQRSMKPEFNGNISYLGLTGEGTGDATGDLSKLVPSNASENVSRDIRMFNNTNKRPLQIVIDMKTSVSSR